MSNPTGTPADRLVSYDPAIGEAVGSVAITPEHEVPNVVARARAAQPAWQALGHQGRAELLSRASQTFADRAEGIGTLVTREMGKPLFVDVLNEVLPEGVLQVVQGADDQGKALVASDVDLVAFTGSADVGKSIMRAASGTLKRVILELGGKDPMIVLESADLAKAAKFAALNSFRNAGQVCVSTERILVPDSIADEFERLLVEAAQTMKQGNGLEEGVDVGPMVNARQRDHVLQQLDDAVGRGATVLSGGSGHHDNFVVPTVLGNVTEDMSIAREETFGPVACVTRVASEEEAVRRANDTHFGLGARQSGYGFHKSKDGHRQFTQTRVVTRPTAKT